MCDESEKKTRVQFCSECNYHCTIVHLLCWQFASFYYVSKNKLALGILEHHILKPKLISNYIYLQNL